MSKKNYLDKNKLDIAYVEKEYFNLFLRIKKKELKKNTISLVFYFMKLWHFMPLIFQQKILKST